METTQELTIIDRSMDVFKNGSAILLANQTRAGKAVEVGKNILAAIEAEGMTPELDQRAMAYLVNCSKAKDDMNDQRAAITQIMDEIKKLFTAEENKLDSKGKDTVPGRIQEKRNGYARQVAEEQERKRKEAERASAKATEAINIKSELEILMYDYYQQIVLIPGKIKMKNAFNGQALETIVEFRKKLEIYTPNLPADFLDKFHHRVSAAYHTETEAYDMLATIRAEKFPEYSANYKAELELLKTELLDLIPSKLNELTEQKRIADEAEAARQAELALQIDAERKRQFEIDNANAAEKRRLEAQAVIERERETERMAKLEKQQAEDKAAAEEAQRVREKEQAEQMHREAEENRKRVALEAEVKKQGEQTMVMFDREAAQVLDTPAPETRAGYEIEVKHQAGFVQLFTLWFENAGKELCIDAIEKTSMKQIKTWAEKFAHTKGTKIESKFLEYNPSYKAVNRKAKTE